jgi:hypothetical protein
VSGLQPDVVGLTSGSLGKRAPKAPTFPGTLAASTTRDLWGAADVSGGGTAMVLDPQGNPRDLVSEPLTVLGLVPVTPGKTKPDPQSWRRLGDWLNEWCGGNGQVFDLDVSPTTPPGAFQRTQYHNQQLLSITFFSAQDWLGTFDVTIGAIPTGISQVP